MGECVVKWTTIVVLLSKISYVYIHNTTLTQMKFGRNRS